MKIYILEIKFHDAFIHFLHKLPIIYVKKMINKGVGKRLNSFKTSSVYLCSSHSSAKTLEALFLVLGYFQILLSFIIKKCQNQRIMLS